MSMLMMVVMGWFITPATESGTLFGRGGEIGAERELGELLYRIDLPDSKVTAISEFKKGRGLTRVDVAPDSKLLVVTWFELVSGYKSEIMDFDGKVLKSMEGVCSAVFIDHAGRRLAVVRSIYKDGDILESQGVWIYDFDTNREEKILDTGIHLEWGNFDNSLYIGFGGEETPGFRYDLSTKEVTETVLGTGGFSPDGKYRWGYEYNGGVKILRWETRETVSDRFELLKSGHHGTPLIWMSSSIIMVPRGGRALENYLLFVETGKTLKVPGNIVSVTDDEEFVYICKPGLILEKLPIANLAVLYEGSSEGSNASDGQIPPAKN